MADIGHERDEATEAALAVAARHALHDEELIAALAVGGSDDDDDLARARSLLERCTTCRDLHADLETISAALRVESRGTMTAPRDFRLFADDARRLGGTISPRGLVRNLRRALINFGRPLGASMATLGVVGVLVGSMSFGSAALAPAVGGDSSGPGAAPTELEEYTGAQQSAPAKSTDTEAFAPLSTVLESIIDESQRDAALADRPITTAVLLAASIGLVVTGLALAWYASRRTDRRRLDPSQFH